LPGKSFAQNGVSSKADESTQRAPHLPKKVNACPHCGSKFKIESQKRPIRFNCNFCGEKIEFK